MQVCQNCGFAELEQTEVTDSFQVDHHLFEAKLPSLRCPKCGTTYTHGPAVEAFERAAAVILVRYGQMSGPIARFLRKVLGLRAKDLAGLLDVTPETVSRWENGERDVARSAAALLGAMVLDLEAGRSTALDALQALREPRQLAERIEVSVEAA